MILVRRVDTLIRLVLRTIMRNILVKHAGIFLFDKTTDEYVVNISRGMEGVKVPAGFAKISKDNVIIKYFTDAKYKSFNQDALICKHVKCSYDKHARLGSKKELPRFLKELKSQLDIFRAEVCIPGFFRNDLIGVLFLGEKIDKKSFMPEELSFLSILGSDVVMAIQNAWLFEDLNKQVESNKKIFFDAVNALGTAIETKDKYTGGHTGRVLSYAVEIAENLLDPNNSKDFRDNLIVAAFLHDIGKIGVPERVLNKKAKLNEKEKNLIYKHPMMGIDILEPIKEYKEAISGIKYHHERFDGKGYPFSLKGKKIPLIASIISVADAFDAMTTERPYRKALSRDEALLEIKKNRGKQFNPQVVDAFFKAQALYSEDYQPV